MLDIQVVGCGGVGSSLTQPLAKFLGYYDKTKKVNIKFIDGDRVEKSNLTRQAFVTSDVNLMKATIMSEVFKDILESSGKSVTSTPICEYLDKNNIKDHIKNKSITFVGVDNKITRFIIEQHVRKLSNALVFFGGNEYHDGDVNVIRVVNRKLKTPLYTDKHPEIKEPDIHPNNLSCAEESPSAPQLILANQQVSQLMLNGFYQYMSSGNIDWHQVYFDLQTNRIRYERIQNEKIKE